jgi:putative FmdB family regulatory protein
MPTYSYYCKRCDILHEIFSSISEYTDTIKCDQCQTKCSRSYIDDMLTLNSYVKKTDSELKTLGDLANRNRDRMSEDHKNHLTKKHNEYKDTKIEKELPAGMSRIEKPKQKTKWR